MDITSQSSLQTTYIDPDTAAEVTETKTSNAASTVNLTMSITKEKECAKTQIKRNEEVAQDNTITNGTQLILTAITFTETLSEGMSFVPGSVELNGEIQADADPTAGITLTDMNPNDTALITYKVKFNEDSTQATGTSKGTIAYTVGEEAFSEDTNIIEFTAIENAVKLVISANKSAVVKGNTIHYTVNITNEGTLNNTNLTFTNPIPNGTTFVAGSVIINDTPNADADPATGFALPNLDAAGTIKVEFEVTVN